MAAEHRRRQRQFMYSAVEQIVARDLTVSAFGRPELETYPSESCPRIRALQSSLITSDGLMALLFPYRPLY